MDPPATLAASTQATGSTSCFCAQARPCRQEDEGDEHGATTTDASHATPAAVDSMAMSAP